MTFCFYDNWIHTPEETHERRNKNNMKPSDDPPKVKLHTFPSLFSFALRAMKFNTMSEGWAVACMGVKPGRRGLHHHIDEMHFLSPPTSARLVFFHHRSRERILVKGSNFYNSILKIHFEKYFQFRVLRVMQKRRKRSTLEWWKAHSSYQ